MLESNSCVFPHRFHQIFAAMTNFAHIVPVLSSNSEPILKTWSSFRIRTPISTFHISKSIRIFFWIRPSLSCWGQRILNWSKSGHKIIFSWSQGFCQFWESFLKIAQATSFACLSSYFLWLLFCAPKWRKNIKKRKRKSQNFPKKQRQPKEIEKREGQNKNNI